MSILAPLTVVFLFLTPEAFASDPNETDWDQVDEELINLPENPSEDPELLESLFPPEDWEETPGPETFSSAWTPPDYEGQVCTRLQVHVFVRPQGLGVPYEFGALELDGQVKNFFVLSSGRKGEPTVTGDFPLRFARVKNYPFPWLISEKYENSPMYWGLRIYKGYWIHSTTHYKTLGRPASMGCVRLTFPSAMEIWDQAVNYVRESSRITLYPSGSAKAADAYQRLKANAGLTDADVIALIEADLADAHAVSTHEYLGNGHWRRDPSRVLDRFVKGYYPGCYDKSCFKLYGRRPRPVLTP